MKTSNDRPDAGRGRWMFFGLILIAFATTLLVIAQSQKKGAVKAIKPPTLAINAVRPPAGADCAQAKAGDIVDQPLPWQEGEPPPCWLTFIIDADETAQYVALQLEALAGSMPAVSAKPHELNGVRPFSGKVAWSLQLPSPLNEPLVIRVAAASSDRIVNMDLEWLKSRQYNDAAINFLKQRGFSVIHQKIVIKP